MVRDAIIAACSAIIAIAVWDVTGGRLTRIGRRLTWALAVAAFLIAYWWL